LTGTQPVNTFDRLQRSALGTRPPDIPFDGFVSPVALPAAKEISGEY